MDFRAKRLEDGCAPATVNKDLRQIRSAFSYAVDAGLLRTHLLLRWKGLMLREPERAVRVVEENEFAALLKACENPALTALLVVAYRQGLRRTELINLRWEAVDLERQILHVVNVPEAGELTKSRKNRSLPGRPAVAETLAALWGGVPKRLAVVLHDLPAGGRGPVRGQGLGRMVLRIGCRETLHGRCGPDVPRGHAAGGGVPKCLKWGGAAEYLLKSPFGGRLERRNRLWNKQIGPIAQR